MSGFSIALPRKKRRRRRKPQGGEWILLLFLLEVVVMFILGAVLLFFREIPANDPNGIFCDSLGIILGRFFWWFTWPIGKPIIYTWIVGEDE